MVIESKRLSRAHDDLRVIVSQPLRRRRRRVLSQVLDVIAGVKSNDRIAECREMSIRVEVFPMHAAVAGGVNEQRTLGRGTRVFQMQAKGMAVEGDRLI